MSGKKANIKLTTLRRVDHKEEFLKEDRLNEQLSIFCGGTDYDNINNDDNTNNDYEEVLVKDANNEMHEEFGVEEGNKKTFKRKYDKLTRGNEDEQVADKKTKKKKKKITVSTKPPTAEEMGRLRETENLFHSNLFRMQIEELIKEVKTKKVERKSMKSWLGKLKNFILGMDDITECSLHIKDMDGIQLPIWNVPQESKGFFHLMKPESVEVVGSYKAGCCLGPNLKVDVAVVIPKKCFLKEDYKNARYHIQRIIYLAALAKHLERSDLVQSNLQYCAKDGHPIKSCLLVHPVGSLSSVSVYIYAVPNAETFKLSRFLPDKSNMRGSWWTSGGTEDLSSCTPQYNSSIVKDLVIMENEEVRANILQTNSNLIDAVALLQVWLKQRELDTGYGGFTGYLMSMLVVHLSRCHRLNNLMSSYQVVRNVWLMISQSDWTNEGITMASQQDSNLLLFQQFYEVVFLDVTGFCNLAASLTRHTYLKVKREAELALKCLDNPDINSFQALFMTPVPFFRQFDHVICVKNYDMMGRVIKMHSTVEEQMDYMGFTTPLFIKILTNFLSKILTDRVLEITVKLATPVTWPVHSSYTVDNSPIVVGLRLNPDTALGVIEKGPLANLPEADTFREFWGDISELRRFKDSSVCEAIMWEQPSAPICRKRLIVQNIVIFMLKKKLHLEDPDFTYIADQLEHLIKEKKDIPADFECGTGEEACRKVVQSFDQLAKQLRDLKDLPLDITSTQGISPVFRYCDVFPPLSAGSDFGEENKINYDELKLGKFPNYISPVEAVIQLGLSRKWPEDREAVRRIRAAFNIQIAAMLHREYQLAVQPFTEFVDVSKDGFVFRLRVAYAREIVLLKETVLPDGKIRYRDTPESLQLERVSVHLPKLTGAISGVSLQYHGFGPATCLAKRWLNAQMIDSSHFPDIVTELLMAYIFLSPEPFSTVLQPQTAFLRFLNLLATTNWYLDPIIVNFNSDMKRDDLVEIESHFRNERSTLPQLFIATQYDKTSSLWTREVPSLPILVRLARLAAESLTIVESNFLVTGDQVVYKQIFRPSLDVYDVLIRINPQCNVHKCHNVDWTTYRKRAKKGHQDPVVLSTKKRLPVTGFDPVQCYLSELRENYDEFALFFHDSFGGVVIGTLFKPTALKPQEFKVSHINCRKPRIDGKSEQLLLNIDALIEDFYIIGKDLVTIIDIHPRIANSHRSS